MENGIIKLSIIIPTRERHESLQYTLKSVLSINRDDIEVVVSDNYSSIGTYNVVSKFNDKRIQYYRTDKRLSMVENFEQSIKLARGDYLTILGDDDCIVADMLCEIEKHLTPDVPVCWMRFPYFWPNATEQKNKLFVNKAQYFTRLPSEISLEFLLQYFLNYQYFPSLYNSIVHRDIVDRIMEYNHNNFGISGFYINGVIAPDVFSAMLIMKFTESYVFSGVPFSLSGISKFSNGIGASNNYENRDSKLFSKEFGKNKISEMFHSSLPKVDNVHLSVLSDHLLFIDNYIQNEVKKSSKTTVRSACKYFQEKALVDDESIGELLNNYSIEKYSVEALNANIVGGDNASLFCIPTNNMMVVDCSLHSVFDAYGAGDLYNDIVFNNLVSEKEKFNTLKKIKYRIKEYF